MIASMTGFGRAEKASEDWKITVEMKSVNNRYLDINPRLPRRFASFDAELRNIIKEYVSRGKIDVFVTAEKISGDAGTLRFNEELAKSYYQYLLKISRMTGQEVTVRDVATAEDVFTLEAEDGEDEDAFALLEETLREACASFRRSRTDEGQKLKTDLLEKLSMLLELTEKVIADEPRIMEGYRERLFERMKEILEDRTVDESRILAECVVFADRICTDEETVRLKSHIGQMEKALSSDDGIGRKLDFIAQEMNREANTILSKAGDLLTADTGIEMKTLIEKIREQIQNIE